MILVNNPGSSAAYEPLKHARWNGWTPTDLIFPFFLFIVGVSLVLSFEARLQRGDSRKALVLHTLRRSATIFAIGLLLNALPHFHPATWRIPGVLQRIAVAYLAAALITLYSGTKARIAWIASLLLGYWALMRFMPVPGYGIPTHDIPLLHPNANLAAYLDRKLMFGHLWEGTRDPEGVAQHIAGNRHCAVWSPDRRMAACQPHPRRKAAAMLGSALQGSLPASCGESGFRSTRTCGRALMCSSPPASPWFAWRSVIGRPTSSCIGAGGRSRSSSSAPTPLPPTSSRSCWVGRSDGRNTSSSTLLRTLVHRVWHHCFIRWLSSRVFPAHLVDVSKPNLPQGLKSHSPAPRALYSPLTRLTSVLRSRLRINRCR